LNEYKEAKQVILDRLDNIMSSINTDLIQYNL
jgi:hypothetical protein